MNIGITGNTGFIGSAFIKDVSKDRNYHLFPFNRDLYSLSSVESLKKFVAGKHVILHLAGITKAVNIEDYFTVNTLGTLNLLEAIHRYGNSNTQFIFASSFAVYQESNKKILLSEKTKTKPRNHYGISKVLAEEIVDFYNRQYAIPIRILRISNPYGPTNNKSYNGIISILTKKIQKEELITINGDGLQSRDFIYIDDVIEALKKTLKYKKNTLLVNICSGTSIQIIEVVKKIESILGKNATVTYNKDYFEEGFWIGDPKKAEKEIQFKAYTLLDEGIKKTTLHYISKK